MSIAPDDQSGDHQHVAFLKLAGSRGLKAVGKVERVREIDGKISCETAYYLLSAPLSPERLNEVVRAHWGVENV